jgi:threonine dehydrogenase-like Zn-dependent dehydrogenase
MLLPGDRRVLVEQFADPAPGIGEVVVRIKASAICRSDMSLHCGQPVVQAGKAGGFISGHEAAGIMEMVGQGVMQMRPGQRVAVHDRLLEMTGGSGVDAAVDCTGNGSAQNAALDAARPFGRVAFIGESKETTIRASDQLIRKQLSLMGCWYFSAADYSAIMRCITERKVPIDKLIAHRFSLDEAAKAFQMFDERKTEKAVFLM